MPTSLPPAYTATPFSILRIAADAPEIDADLIAVEEPLEIQLGYTRRGIEIRKTVAITMRTPGHDQELAAGFLFTEGVVHSSAEIAAVEPAPDTPNAVVVTLRPDVAVELRTLDRNNYITSSCGVCGKGSLDAVRTVARHPLPEPEPQFEPAVIHRLPQTARAAQHGFGQTGGLHAAALFDRDGRLIAIREDVGRHNALDKIIGARLLGAGREAIPLSDRILFVSSRASFELVQKTIMAGCPVLAAVGAPTSLAVELARDTGATLLGFVRENRFNVYAGATRLRALTSALMHS